MPIQKRGPATIKCNRQVPVPQLHTVIVVDYCPACNVSRIRESQVPDVDRFQNSK